MQPRTNIPLHLMRVAVHLVLLLGFVLARIVLLAETQEDRRPDDSSPEPHTELVAVYATPGDPLLPSRIEPLPQEEIPARRGSPSSDGAVETLRPIPHGAQNTEAVRNTYPPRYCSFCSLRM